MGAMETDKLDCELARRIREGDVGGLTAALGKFWVPLVNYVASLGLDGDSAEDVAQQTLVRLWERREKLKVEGSLRGLLFRIARNLCFDLLRQRTARDRVTRDTPVGSNVPTPFDHTASAELRTIIEAAINSLPQRRREVFLLVRYHGLSHREVAEMLGLAPQTVANHLGMALDDLRASLVPYLPDYYCPRVSPDCDYGSPGVAGALGA
jgi:RNA polymerase sigma-70 factor (ECF subfamily)